MKCASIVHHADLHFFIDVVMDSEHRTIDVLFALSCIGPDSEEDPRRGDVSFFRSHSDQLVGSRQKLEHTPLHEQKKKKWSDFFCVVNSFAMRIPCVSNPTQFVCCKIDTDSMKRKTSQIVSCLTVVAFSCHSPGVEQKKLHTVQSGHWCSRCSI